MANSNELNTRVELPPAQQPSQAILQILADTHGSGGETTRPASLSEVNVHREINADMTTTSFPNGVKFGKGMGATVVEAPLGGAVNGRKDGGMNVFDAHHNKVAELDQDKVLHVHGKYGEYSETASGQVQFKMAHGAEKAAKHHNGEIPGSKLESYGVSKNGSETRFPNGIEYDTKGNRVTVPSELYGFSEDKRWDSKTNSVQSIGTDGDGRVLYKRDAAGIHVPTSDGILSENQNGAVRFDKPPSKTAHGAATGKHHSSEGLPPMTIEGRDLKPEIDCFKSNDPLCGLDLDGKF